MSKKSNCNLYFPEDVNTGKHFNDKSTNKKINEIENDDIILDIGEKQYQKLYLLLISQRQFYGMDLQVILKTQILQKEVLR